jgi:phosphatidylglycerol:prolipoprotein diacylglycerol transferase
MSPRFAYAAFMLLALGVFLLVRRIMPKPAGLAQLPWTQQLALALSAFVGGVFGAKLPFVISSGQSWLSEGAWLADGKTVVTGLAGGYLAVEIAKLFLGIRIKTGDTFALPLALALAVGRWGCFCNGCCFGAPTSLPWAIDFGDGVMRHPTQIYESLFHATMACILLYLALKNWLPTHRLQFYLIGYGIYRFTTEFIRPEPEWWLGLTFYQYAALGLAAGLAGQWLWEAKRARNAKLDAVICQLPSGSPTIASEPEPTC